MKKSLFTISILLLFIVDASARLGLTRSECDKKYGKPFYTEENYGDYVSEYYVISVHFAIDNGTSYSTVYKKLLRKSDKEDYIQAKLAVDDARSKWSKLYYLYKETKKKSDSLAESELYPAFREAEAKLKIVPLHTYSDSVNYDTVAAAAIRDAVLPKVQWKPFQKCTFEGIIFKCHESAPNSGFWQSTDGVYEIAIYDKQVWTVNRPALNKNDKDKELQQNTGGL